MAVKERSSYTAGLYGLTGDDHAYDSGNAYCSYHNIVPQADIGYYQRPQSRIDTTYIGEAQRHQLVEQDRRTWTRSVYDHYPQGFTDTTAASHYVPIGSYHQQGQSIGRSSDHSWRTTMFGAQEVGGMRDWKSPGTEAYNQEWNCPSLIDGAEDQYSPSTSLGYSPISPASSTQGDAKAFFTDAYDGQYSNQAFTECNIIQSNSRTGSMSSASSIGNLSPMKSSFTPVPFDHNNIVSSGLMTWQWDPSLVTMNHRPSSCWMPSTPALPQASNLTLCQTTGGLTGSEPFPAFGPGLAAEERQSLYNMSHQTHEQHIVPRLLSNINTDESIFDGETTDDAASPEATSPFGNEPTNNLFAAESRSSAARLAKAPRILASQRSSKTSTSKPSKSLFSPLAPSRNDQSPEDRNHRDEYLLELRAKGLSYKEIKRRGGFTEAESTLRGRVRILSRPKHERVRKPQWSQKDIALLDRAVRACASEAPHASPTTIDKSPASANTLSRIRPSHDMPKPPWKKVAQWMQNNGSSYPFAAATCAKKWDEYRSQL